MFSLDHPMNHSQGSKVDHSTPWSKIFTSMPFLSLMIVHCAHNWGFWTLLTKIPSYMKTVLEFDIKQVGSSKSFSHSPSF